ncbi:MAG: hypothetical protein AAF660_13170 [Pseudomonadota bacterium]
MHQTLRMALIAACTALSACTTTDTVALAKESAGVLFVAASQGEYVDACTVRRNSDLECQVEFEETRGEHQAYYREQQTRRRQQSVDALSEELADYFNDVEQGSGKLR